VRFIMDLEKSFSDVVKNYEKAVKAASDLETEKRLREEELQKGLAEYNLSYSASLTSENAATELTRINKEIEDLTSEITAGIAEFNTLWNGGPDAVK